MNNPLCGLPRSMGNLVMLTKIQLSPRSNANPYPSENIIAQGPDAIMDYIITTFRRGFVTLPKRTTVKGISFTAQNVVEVDIPCIFTVSCYGPNGVNSQVTTS